MKLTPLGETDAAACVDGVCEVPALPATPNNSAAQQPTGDQENTQPR